MEEYYKKITPCICGSKNLDIRCYGENKPNQYLYQVICRVCNHKGGLWDSHIGAMDRWNEMVGKNEVADVFSFN